MVVINISWRTFPSPGQKVLQRTLTQSLTFDVYRLCVRSLHVVNDVWICFTGLLLKESNIWLNIFNLTWLQTEDVTAGCQKLSDLRKCCLIIHMIVLGNAFHNPETLKKTKNIDHASFTSTDSKIVHYFIVLLEQLRSLSCRNRTKMTEVIIKITFIRNSYF